MTVEFGRRVSVWYISTSTEKGADRMGDEKCSKCGAVITGTEPAYLIDERDVACRSCHDMARPLCPHCGILLTRTLPKTWSKCSQCGERFWVEPQQWLYPSMILTPDQRKAAQEIVREMSRLSKWGVSPEDRKVAELRAQFDGHGAEAVIRSLRIEAIKHSGWIGPPEPTTLADDDIDVCVRSFDMFSHRAQTEGNYGVTLGDVIAAWLAMKPSMPQVRSSEDEEDEVYDELADEHRLISQVWPLALERASNDPHARKIISFCWAESRAIAGLDFREQLQQAQRYALLEHQSHKSITRVRIVNWQEPCAACRRQNGKVLTIEQALERMPLPCPDCTTQYEGETVENPKGWCQCSYEAVFEDE